MEIEEKHIIDIRNKRATFEYFLLQSFVAGMQLYGTEIKSIRQGKANLSDAYCTFVGDELWVNNLHIAEYKFGSYYNHQEKRARKLLLNKNELKKLQTKTKEKGLTIIPVLLFVDSRGYAKLEIALAKGKKSYDKRESIKANDSKREMDRMMKKEH